MQQSYAAGPRFVRSPVHFAAGTSAAPLFFAVESPTPAAAPRRGTIGTLRPAAPLAHCGAGYPVNTGSLSMPASPVPRPPAGFATPDTLKVANHSQVEPVIFLDVDGVLHSLFGDDLFAEGCCSLFEQLVKHTGAKIVLSSTWRLEAANMAELDKMLEDRGLLPVEERTLDLGTHREFEICEWLDRHPEVTNWIAIDDMDLVVRDNDHARRLQGHFVRTDMNVGLTPPDADLALRLLSTQGRQAAPAPPPGPPPLRQRERAATWAQPADRSGGGSTYVACCRNTSGARLAAAPWPYA